MDDPGAGGPPAGAVMVPMEAAAPAAAAGARQSACWTRHNARLAWAAALLLLGCAAAGLAFFAMILPPADSRQLGQACAPPTDAEVARLRTASEHLLLSASALVLTATMGLLVPGRPFAFFGWLVGWITAIRASFVLWLLVSCHGSVHGEVAFHFWLFYAVLLAAIPVTGIASIC